MSSRILRSFRLRIVAPFITVPVLAFCLNTHAADLAEVYALAVENDHEFRAARAGYLASSEAKNLSRAGLLPKVNGQAEWSESQTETSGTSPFPRAFGKNDSSSSGYSISVNQPLFDLAAWQSFKSGAANASAAEANFRSSEQALIIRTSQAYFDALLAASNLETSLAQEEALHHQLMQTKQRYDVGLSAITEVHEAQAAFDSSVAERLLAEGRLGIAFEAVEVLTGKPFNALGSLKPDFSATGPQPADRESWVEQALESNYQLLASKYTADAAKFDAKSAKSGHLPTLGLSGVYSNQENDDDAGQDIETDSTSVTLTLTVPIYNGGSVSAQRRQAKQLAIQSRESYLKLRRDIVQSARSEHLNVVTGVSTVKAREQAIISRESALEATQAGYRVGTRDLVDVLNAQQTLYQAKRDYNTALFDYILSSLNLKQVAGQLSQNDIEKLNAWLDVENPIRRTQ